MPSNDFLNHVGDLKADAVFDCFENGPSALRRVCASLGGANARGLVSFAYGLCRRGQIIRRNGNAGSDRVVHFPDGEKTDEATKAIARCGSPRLQEDCGGSDWSYRVPLNTFGSVVSDGMRRGRLPTLGSPFQAGGLDGTILKFT
jgi:hypothetical protein